MKTHIQRSIVSLIFLIAIVSCLYAQERRVPITTYKLDKVYYPNPKDRSYSYTFKFAIDYFKNPPLPSIYAVINSELLHYFSLPNTQNNNFKEAIQSVVEAEIDDYKSYYDEATEGMSDSQLQYTLDMKLKYKGCFRGVQSFLNYFNTYTGGVHPMDSFTTLNFDARNGRLLELTDVMKSGFEAKLQQLILFKLDKEILFDKNNVDLPTEFIFHEIGIEFIYNRYVLASYTEGPQFVMISYNDLEDLLKSEYSQNQLRIN